MTPRVDPADRRAEILEAALRCFARSGYKDTSMDDIVRESGLSKGTLYWHFKNKRELFMALFDRIIEQILAPFAEMFDVNLPPTERLYLMSSATAHFNVQDSDIMALPLNFLIEVWQDETFMKRYRGMLEQFVARVEAILKEGIASGEFREIDVQATAWGLMALYDGIFLYHIAGMPGDVAHQIEVMTELIIAGLQQQEE